jgi:adenosylmethionine-8-amino-7-oxononanoate aminotransferase
MPPQSRRRDLYNQNLLHPWADLPTLGEDDSTSVIERGEGCYIYDEHGQKLLDGPAGMWCMQTGYGRREIADAVAEQIMELGYASSFSVIHPKEVELARRIAGQTPGDLNRIFFTTGGSTAVDSALRLCQMANNIKGCPDRKHIIARDRGYHGSTFLAASVTGKERDKSALDKLQDRVHFVSAPCRNDPQQHLNEAELCDFLVDELESKILEIGPDKVMCLIAEPVLASGGVIVPPAGYNRRCRELTRKYGIVYIADEVVTGFGRLGHWFASEAVFDVVPDIIVFAKGVTSGYIPLGGIAVSDALMAAVSGEQAGGNCFNNGYTWSGNPVACAAALASWDIIERENLLEHVREIGPYFQQQLRTLNDIPLVAEVRGMGLMGAVEMRIARAPGVDTLEADYTIGDLVDHYCQQYGLLVRPFINICIMSPPLVITRAQVDEMVNALRKGLEAALAELRKQGIWREQ